MKRPLLVLVLMLAVSPLWATTNSEIYKNLETNSPERTALINSENARVNQKLKSSPSFKAISSELKQYIDFENTLDTEKISEHEILKIVDTGLGKPLLVKLFTDDKPTVLFSSEQLSRKGQYQYQSKFLSPDKKNLVLSFYNNGNIDDFYILDINLESKEILFQQQTFDSQQNRVFWKGNDELIFTDAAKAGKEDHCKIFIPSKKEINDCENGIVFYGSNDNFIRLGNTDSKTTALWDSKGKKYLDTQETIDLGDMLTVDENATETNALYQVRDKNYPDDLIFKKAILSDSAEPSVQITFTISNHTYESFSKLDNYYFFTVRWGLERSIFVFKNDGAFISKIDVSKIYGWSLESWKIPGLELNFVIKGLEKNKTITLDLSETKVAVPDFSEGWNLKGMKLSVVPYMIPSFDGTMVPVKIIKDENFNGDLRPAFIQVYGGFNSSGYLFNNSRGSLLQMMPFLKRGGMIVNTGVRGGNEYGKSWHEAAMKKNKGKTFEDTASVAKYLIDNKLSKKEIITLSGSSNGGYVTATTGLLYQEYFGLIIPHAGVHDQLNKKKMDWRFNGWVREYLDEDNVDEKDFLPAISPLELAAGNVDVDFLILSGRNDSRVNPAHSYKLDQALKSTNKKETYLYTMNNNGHFEMSYTIGEFASWRDWSIIWSFVIDRL
jgi:protease II